MVFFRVTENINIKIQDGSLVKFEKLKRPSQLINDNIYITTYDDLGSIEEIFSNVGEKYKAKTIDENRIRRAEGFPRELGISNAGELEAYAKRGGYVEFYLNDGFENIEDQALSFKKGISIAIIGGVGSKIGESICGMNAVRILYERLLQRFKSVKIDVFINSSDNKFYKRDRSVLEDEPYINMVSPLAISVKKLCEYDFFIDNSSLSKHGFYNELPFIDAYLHKFGIEFEAIDPLKKHNMINLGNFIPEEALEQKICDLKQKGKLLLFHPYSSDVNRSIPKDIAKKLLQKLLRKSEEYIIVSALALEDIKDERFVSLSEYSKGYKEFAYIVSNMDALITADTSAYHIADAFLIPSVVIFTTVDPYLRIKYYQQAKAVEIESKAKNYGHFKFSDDKLTLYRFEGWKDIKAGKLLKMLQD